MSEPAQPKFRVASDKPFLIGLGVLAGSYLLIISPARYPAKSRLPDCCRAFA